MRDQPEIKRQPAETPREKPRDIDAGPSITDIGKLQDELLAAVKRANDLEKVGGEPAEEASRTVLKAAAALAAAETEVSAANRAHVRASSETLPPPSDLQPEVPLEGGPLTEESQFLTLPSRDAVSDGQHSLSEAEQKAGLKVESAREVEEADSGPVADQTREQAGEEKHARRDVRDQRGGRDEEAAAAREVATRRRDVRGARPELETAASVAQARRSLMAGLQEVGASEDIARQVEKSFDRVLAREDREQEKFERSPAARPPDGVGFRFDENNPAAGEVDRYLKNLPEQKRRSLEDPTTQVTLTISASRPGSEEYNQRLSEQRGEALKHELEQRGVRAEITVVPLGEQEARREHRSPMSVKEPSDRDPEDRRDDHWDRTAKIDIPPAEVPDGVAAGGSDHPPRPNRAIEGRERNASTVVRDALNAGPSGQGDRSSHTPSDARPVRGAGQSERSRTSPDTSTDGRSGHRHIASAGDHAEITRHDQSSGVRLERPQSTEGSDVPVRGEQERPESLSEAREQIERHRIAVPYRGIGFGYDERSAAAGAVKRLHDSLPKEVLEDARAILTLKASASRPGSEIYNQRLSELRGQFVADELRAVGVRAQIRIEASGEQAARQGGSVSMSLNPPGDRDAADARDDHRHRSVIVEIQPFQTVVEMEPERIEGQPQTAERLQNKLDRGERTMQNEIADRFGEDVRNQVPLLENPFLPDPSKDPVELVKQGVGIATRILKGALKAAVKGQPVTGLLKETGKRVGGAIIYESLGARDQMRVEVANQRKPLYEAIARGLASGLDSGYADRSNWQPKTDEQRRLYEGVRQTAEAWSDQKQEEVGLFLTLFATESVQSYNHLTNPGPGPAGDYYYQGAVKFFQYGKYWHSEGGAQPIPKE